MSWAAPEPHTWLLALSRQTRESPSVPMQQSLSLVPVENAVTVGMVPDEEQLIPPEQVA